MQDLNLNIPEHNKLMVLITIEANRFSTFHDEQTAVMFMSHRIDLRHETMKTLGGHLAKKEFKKFLKETYEIWGDTSKLKVAF